MNTTAPQSAAATIRDDECTTGCERNAWMETASQHARNEDYYRGLVVQIGEMLGPQAYVSDDGSVQEDVLCAKVPELVAEIINTHRAFVAAYDAASNDKVFSMGNWLTLKTAREAIK